MSGSFPSPGEVFQDRYRIVSVINRGGFGRVYLASQLELNRDVAIKVLQPITRDGVDADEESRRLAVVKKRFEREGQLVSQLRDSHTVVMHDYGTTNAGLLYMVLEYVDGRPLDKVIEEEGALDPERVVKITRQVLWSLQEAHALNMLHRDVKPQNIMVFDHAGRTDQVKVLDFGLAKSAESAEFRAEDPDLTGDEVILGTPRYMSPEQIRGEPLGPSTDLYSLGLVMFEMLTGYKAVTGESTMNTLARHLNDVPIRLPADIVIPTGLRDIVDRMLAKNNHERLQSSEDALDALEFWDASTSVLGGGDSDPLATAPAFLEERRRQTLVWTAMGMISLFLVVAVLSAAMKDDGPKTATTVRMDELDHAIPSVQRVAEPAEPAGNAERPHKVVEFEDDEPVVAEAAAVREAVKVAAADPRPGETNGREPSAPDEQVDPAAGATPDMGAPTVVEIDAGTLEPARYPEPTEPPRQEKKSTKTDNSGKKKKLELDIGILK